MTGRLEVTGGRLQSAAFELVLLRHREDPESDMHDDEFFNVVVSTKSSAEGTVLFEAKGFSRTARSEDPDFVGLFEAWVEP